MADLSCVHIVLLICHIFQVRDKDPSGAWIMRSRD